MKKGTGQYLLGLGDLGIYENVSMSNTKERQLLK